MQHIVQGSKSNSIYMSQTSDKNAAGTTVLSTPELLDIVLEHCEERELVRLQRVSRRFRQHITGTKRLRTRLCLEVDPKSIAINNKHTDKESLGRIENTLHPSIFIEDLFRSPSDRHAHNIEGEPIEEKWSIADQLARWKDQNFLLLHLPRDVDTNPTCYGPEASWRSMTLTQPPIYAVGVFMGAPRYAGDTSPRSPDYKVITNQNGVRLGDVFDNICERADTPWLKAAPLAIAVLQLASYERTYSACYHAFLRYKGPSRS